MALEPTVFIVDDDPAVRDSLSLLVRSVGLIAQSYESAAQFLDLYEVEIPGCLVLDIRMPGMSGLELQERLAHYNVQIPIIFITGHGDVPMAVHAIQNGAVDFLEKPFSDQVLLDRVHDAIEHDAARRRSKAQASGLSDRLARLTPREREVVDLVMEGKSSKTIAEALTVSKKTVDLHRAHAMQKMGAANAAELVRIVATARMGLSSQNNN